MAEEQVAADVSQEAASTSVEQAATTEVSAEQPAAVSDWRADLPEEIRLDPSMSTINDVSSLAKGYIHAQRMIGRDKIPLPSDSATDDEWNAVYDRLGRPSSPSEYQHSFQSEESLPGQIDQFNEAVHKLGLTEKQRAGIIDMYEGMLSETSDSMERGMGTRQADVEAELKREYGQTYENAIARANNSARFFGLEDDFMNLQLADGTMLGNHPALIRAFAKVGDSISESTVTGETTNQLMTPAEAQRQLDDVRRMDGPYWDKKHPEHDRYVDEASRLYEMIHGDEAA